MLLAAGMDKLEDFVTYRQSRSSVWWRKFAVQVDHDAMMVFEEVGNSLAKFLGRSQVASTVNQRLGPTTVRRDRVHLSADMGHSLAACGKCGNQRLHQGVRATVRTNDSQNTQIVTRPL